MTPLKPVSSWGSFSIASVRCPAPGSPFGRAYLAPAAGDVPKSTAPSVDRFDQRLELIQGVVSPAEPHTLIAYGVMTGKPSVAQPCSSKNASMVTLSLAINSSRKADGHDTRRVVMANCKSGRAKPSVITKGSSFVTC